MSDTQPCHRCGRWAEDPTIVCGQTPLLRMCDRIVVCLACKAIFHRDPEGEFLRGKWPKQEKR